MMHIPGCCSSALNEAAVEVRILQKKCLLEVFKNVMIFAEPVLD